MENKFYELTSPQKSIWYTENYFENTNINNICTSGIIYEDINIEELKKAIYILVQENDSFRIRLSLKNDVPMQYISKFEPFNIETIHVKNMDDFKNIKQEMIQEIFNINDSSLFKFKIAIFPDNSAGVILNIHHIIADSWSLGLTIQKIIEIYHYVKNGEKVLTKGSSYIDYIKKEQEYKQSSKYMEDKSYWNNTFSSIPEIVTIPSITSQEHTSSSYEANRLIFNIDKKLINEIGTFCKENHLTFFNFFISVFAIYINRVSNVNDFVIGTPILNRTSISDKHSTGMFVNTVPVRFTFLENFSFDNFVKNVSQNIIGILRHQKYSYNSILEDIRSKFNNIPNLYNIMFSYQLTKAYDKSLGNYKTNWEFNKCSANDLAIHIYDINDTGTMEINYDYLTSKYCEQDIGDIHKRIIHIISQIVENPAISLNDIDIVTLEEKNKILYEFNNTSTEYPKDKTIIDLFEEQVEKTPDNIAVVFEEQKLTYKELNEKANSLAYYLRFEKNITRNEFVGIMVNRSLEMIISILAVLKSGAAYIPIDPTYPKDRIDYMLKNSNAKILLTQYTLKDIVNFENKLLIDLQNSEFYNDNFTNLEHINTGDDTSYVIFTSGSTGNPKGVVINHKNIVNFVCGMQKEFCLTSNDIIASITTISFDIFVLESLLPLSVGSQIVIANENEQINADAFNMLCIKNNVNMFQTTPSRIQTFLVASNLNFIKKCDKILVGGEPFPEQLLNKLKQLSNASIYNMYGPTETTVWSSYKKLELDQNITIGKPIINTQVYILNKDLSPLPLNIPGDIYISGDGVGKGYLNRKELTDKVFIKNPFVDNSIMYKTGDVGYFNSNGEIVCLGRSDNQVKLRGLRIELGEIENVIQNFPNITKAVVIKQTDNLHEYLCAYFTSAIKINIEEMSKYSEKFLPKYMIPKYFMQINEFPHTPNGKTDRKSLPKINYINNKKSFANPRNTYDIKLIKILQNILHVENISINDDFLELGGDSLSAITLSSYIKKEFEVQLYVKDILNNSKISNLSDFIANNSSSSTIKITPVPKSNYYNVSSAQKRIYFACQMDGADSILYNIPGGIIFEKELDMGKLEKCINTIIQRQESLRTYFEIENENVVQKIKNNIDFKLDVLNNVNFENIDSIFKDFVKPFDLSKAPLFRINYLKFTNGKNAIFIDMHHIISDGTSLSIFIDELVHLYNNVSLPELKISYKDYSSYEFNKLNSGGFNNEKEYWLNQFNGEIPVLNMPTNFPRPSVQSFAGKKVHSTINTETYKKISNVCSLLGVTPYMFLLSCYYILLSKYTSQDDIIIGSPIVGREIAETYNIIGMFVNTLALRNKIDFSNSFKDFILTVKENLLDAFKYQTYPFDELVKNLNLPRDTSRNPLFDTMFTYQNNGYKAKEINGINAKYYIPDTNISKFDLSIEAMIENDIINLSFEYATDLFNSDFIKQLSNHYLNILQEVSNNLDIKISDIQMLSNEEKDKIIYAFNNNNLNYPKDKNIVELFEKQVIKTPNNLAVIFQNQKITYKELNEKANCFSNYLLEIGVKKGDIIPIVMNRTIDLIISMLATIKIGAVYLPISVETPLERIKYIIQDSNSKFIITDFEYVSNDDIKIIYFKKINYSNNYSLSNLNIKISPDDILYTIYTSGSTGNPKGVRVTHNNLCNFIHSFNNLYKTINSKDRLLSSTSISFDVSIFELFISLLNGSSLYLYDESHIKDIYKYCESLYKNKITFAYIPPNILDLVYEILSSYDRIYLNKLLIGVEPIKSNTIKKYYSLNPNLKIVNAYGPTETTICATGILIDKKIIDKYEILPIGKPLNNLQIYILDKNMSIVPINIPGEIYIAGDNVSKGYLNNDELTNKSFIRIDKLNCDYAYKTGDLATWDKDGNINFIGRNDFQLKLNGYRIEIKEVESAILRFPHIKKVIVQKQSMNHRDFLTAYYVSDRKIALNELKNYLSTFLPKYMVPSYYISLDDFPYNSNGKIDRKALPLPSAIINSNKENFIAPSTVLQKQLANIFEKLLNIYPIGINDNFFELGGDSILAMNLNIELLKISDKITYKDIFMYSTVAELEQKINSNNDTPFFNKIENLSDSFNGILNKTTNMKKILKYKPKNILLTGATGFLGMHILERILLSRKSNIYCLVRKGKHISAKEKLIEKLHYYFGMKYDYLLDKRFFIVTGEITKTNFGLNDDDYLKLSNQIDLVINSAANVSHYGNYNDFYSINVNGVNNIIDFCQKDNKKLYHISTISVAGTNLNTAYPSISNNKNIIFNESSLYIGQVIDSFYSYTKFEAETHILTAINQGLDAYILRMGNLMPRLRDGIFQKNIADNDFVGKITSFMKIEAIPDYLFDYELNFTPIDEAAKVIYKILTHPNNTNRIFHIYNKNNISSKKFITLLRKMDYEIKILPEKRFKEKIQEILNNEKTKNTIYNLTNDFDDNLHLNYNFEFTIQSNFTNKYLKKIHYKWPKLTNKYLTTFINLLRREL